MSMELAGNPPSRVLRESCPWGGAVPQHLGKSHSERELLGGPQWQSCSRGCLGEVAGHWALLATMCHQPQLLEKLHGQSPEEEPTLLLRCPSKVLYWQSIIMFWLTKESYSRRSLYYSRAGSEGWIWRQVAVNWEMDDHLHTCKNPILDKKLYSYLIIRNDFS